MLVDNDFNDHRFTLSWNIPIGNKAAKSRVRKAMKERAQRLVSKENKEDENVKNKEGNKEKRKKENKEEKIKMITSSNFHSIFGFLLSI